MTDNPTLASSVNAAHNVEFIEMNDAIALENHLKYRDCAGVVIEGIQGVNGVVEPTAEFLKSARSLCDTYGAVLILDEVQSGYGRTGKFFAHQHAGIKADVITVAKGMGNGFPIAGVLISPDIEAKKGMLGTTFGGNHLACAAGLAVLEILEEESLLENATKMGTYLVEELQKLNSVKTVRGKGLMIGIDLEEMPQIRTQLLKEHGIFTGASGKETLRLLPPLGITIEEAQQFLCAFSKVTQTVEVCNS
jgi:acetylornithine aminotransferase